MNPTEPDRGPEDDSPEEWESVDDLSSVPEDSPDHQLTPEARSMFDAAAAGAEDAVALAESATEEFARETEEMLSAAVAELDDALHTFAGDVDRDLSQAVALADGPVAKQLDATFKLLASGMEEMANAGAYVPFSTDQMWADLNDPSGRAVIDRIRGFAPDDSRPENDDGTQARPVGGVPDDTPLAPGGDLPSGEPAAIPPSGGMGSPGGGASPGWPNTGVVCRTDEFGIERCYATGREPPPDAHPVPPKILPVPPVVKPIPPKVIGDGEPEPLPPPGEGSGGECGCEDTGKVCLPASAVEICFPRDLIPGGGEPSPSPPSSPPPPAPPEEPPTEEPPVPPTEEPPGEWPEAWTVLPQMNWAQEGACAKADRILAEAQAAAAKKEADAERAGGSPGIHSAFGDWLFTSFPDTIKIIEDGAAKLGLVEPSMRDRVSQQFADAARRYSGFSAVMSSPLVNTVIDPWRVEFAGATLSIAATVEKESGFPAGYLSQSARYAFQYLTPQFVPTQPGVDASYLAGHISGEQWTCWTRANGNIPEAFLPLLKIGRTRPGAMEAVTLMLRGVITEDELQPVLRELGVVEPEDRARFVQLAQQWPTASDLVPWMVRDAFDDTVAAKYGFDTGFDQKFLNSPDALRFAKAAGITPERMRYDWRAHWKILSNTQLLDALHRLRENRPEVEAWKLAYEGWKATGEFGPEPKKPIVVTVDDIRYALQINDVVPGMVDWLIATSYNPITRTDAINAFHSGVFTSSDLFHVFLDNGANETDATRGVKIQEGIRARRLANVGGVNTTRQTMNAYKEGTIDRVRADQLLAPIILDPQQRAEMISGADEQVAMRVRGQWIKRARRAYFVGEWTQEQATANLVANHVQPDRAAQLVELWTAEVRGRYREPTIKKLIDWMKYGIITSEDAYQRFIRLGIPDLDARRYVTEGLIVASERTQSKVRQAEADFRRIAKDLKSAKLERTKELEKQQKELEKVIKDAEERRDRILKVLEGRKPAGDEV